MSVLIKSSSPLSQSDLQEGLQAVHQRPLHWTQVLVWRHRRLWWSLGWTALQQWVLSPVCLSAAAEPRKLLKMDQYKHSELCGCSNCSLSQKTQLNSKNVISIGWSLICPHPDPRPFLSPKSKKTSLQFFFFYFSQNLSLCLPAVTLCKPGEFQCKDGSCISNFSRCDQVVNCEDASDEMNCREWPDVAVVAPNQMAALTQLLTVGSAKAFYLILIFFWLWILQRPPIAPVSSDSESKELLLRAAKKQPCVTCRHGCVMATTTAGTSPTRETAQVRLIAKYYLLKGFNPSLGVFFHYP